MQLKHSSRKREQFSCTSLFYISSVIKLKLKRSLSAQGQFSPAGQSLIQPPLEKYEQNLGQN